jgi:hypothetical protein
VFTHLRNRLPLVFIFIVLVMCSGAAATSAPASSLAPGMRIRITTGPAADRTTRAGQQTVGSFVALDDSALVLVDEHGRSVRMPRSSISAIERSEGKYSRGRKALIGLLMGGTVAAGGSAECQDGDCSGGAGAGASDGAAGLFVGAIGAAIGAVLPPGERWIRIDVNGALISQ